MRCISWRGSERHLEIGHCWGDGRCPGASKTPEYPGATPTSQTDRLLACISFGRIPQCFVGGLRAPQTVSLKIVVSGVSGLRRPKHHFCNRAADQPWLSRVAHGARQKMHALHEAQNAGSVGFSCSVASDRQQPQWQRRVRDENPMLILASTWFANLGLKSQRLS